MKSFNEFITESDQKRIDKHVNDLKKFRGPKVVNQNKKEIVAKVKSLVKNWPANVTSAGTSADQVVWQELAKWFRGKYTDR